jgi:trehalose-6-phosphate synthase
MNLVAKEFCASSVDDNGVLILSEFAGAATQLSKGAIVVNPYDTESTADAIYAAYLMPHEERKRRMRLMRSEVKRYDVNRWVEWILNPKGSVNSQDPLWSAGHDLPAADQLNLKTLLGERNEDR